MISTSKKTARKGFIARFCASVLALSLVVGFGSMVHAQDNAVTAKAAKKSHDWSHPDVFGRKVNTQAYRGKVLLVFINSDKTGDKMKPLTKAMVLRYGQNTDVSQLTIVDMRELEWYKRQFKGKVKEHLRKAHKRTIKRISKWLKEGGKPQIQGLDKNLHIVMDWDGKLTKRYKKRYNTQKHVTVVVVGQDGELLGSYREDQIQSAFAAVDNALKK